LVRIAADNGVADAGAREIREKSDLGDHVVPLVCWITDRLPAAGRMPTGGHDRATPERFTCEGREIRPKISQEITLGPRGTYVVNRPGT
jgi:hypothetical protein